MRLVPILFSTAFLLPAVASAGQHARMWEPPACYHGEQLSGSTAPNALVVIEAPSTGFRREQTADAQGKFQAKGLPAGRFRVTTNGKSWEELLDYTECNIPKIGKSIFGYRGERIEGDTTPGATVVIESVDKSFRTEVVADQKGRYLARYLKPGKYTVTAEGMTREVKLRYGDYRRPSLQEQMSAK